MRNRGGVVPSSPGRGKGVTFCPMGFHANQWVYNTTDVKVSCVAYNRCILINMQLVHSGLQLPIKQHVGKARGCARGQPLHPNGTRPRVPFPILTIRYTDYTLYGQYPTLTIPYTAYTLYGLYTIVHTHTRGSPWALGARCLQPSAVRARALQTASNPLSWYLGEVIVLCSRLVPTGVGRKRGGAKGGVGACVRADAWAGRRRSRPAGLPVSRR